MNWNDVVMTCRYTDQRVLALVMSEMWAAAAHTGNQALLSNLAMNSMDSGGVALALDWNGIPVPESLADRLSPSPPGLHFDARGVLVPIEPDPWVQLMKLANEYAMHVTEAAMHEAESRADISREAEERVKLGPNASLSRPQRPAQEQR